MDEDLKRTPLYDIHRRYGGRMVPFGGWEMPVQYAGVLEEHQAVRTAAGLFDASHMGEFLVDGPEALAAVQYLTINDASRLRPGDVQYSALANGEGGLVDDITVYRFSAQRFMLCVNAANVDKDLRWIRAHLERFPRARVEDRSAETALLAIQGPRAQAVLERLTYANLERIPYYGFVQGSVAGIDAVISRTGYTGEDGFELFAAAERAADLWEELLTMGEAHGLVPCGLGARDTLRLEMGYALYGQDIDDTTSPLEAGLSWITRPDKGEFVGREAVEALRREGITTRLAAFVAEERGVPRHGYPLVHAGEQVGTVTSGTLSPSLKTGIGLGYIPARLAAPGTALAVRIREKEVRVVTTTAPFWRRGTARKKRAAK